MGHNEESLIEYLREEYIPDLENVKNKYSKWDCISKESNMIVELKCRNRHYDALLIEKNKYDALLEKASTEFHLEPWYINSTPKGIYAWNLDKVEIEWKEETQHPASTSFKNRRRVPKVVGYLKIKDAVVLEEKESD